VAFLIASDIHGNLEALEAVLADARGSYRQILCLGDLVGYGADPNAIVDWARAHASLVIRGNHDKACVGRDLLESYNPAARQSAEWTRAALTPESAAWLEQLPGGPVHWPDSGNGFDLVHGSPADEDEYLIALDDVRPLRPLLTSRVTFFGHTHVQGGFLLTRGGVKRIMGEGTLELEPHHYFLLNPGSVGQPRDGDPRAAYIVYSPEEGTVDYRRVPYDVQKAAGKILAAGLPEPLAARLFHGV
jgi:predicted phosphodiesterase